MKSAEIEIDGQAGFTLIEIIAVLILTGVLAAMVGSGLAAAVQGYLVARESSALSQKAQLALNRLTREYRLCYDCDDGTLDQFTNFLGERTITLENSRLLLDGDPLVDRVAAFRLQADDDIIKITLELKHLQTGSDLTFRTSVFPRNTYE